MKFLKILVHIFIVAFLTLLTQIGGIVWILVFLFFKVKHPLKSKIYRLTVFTISYNLCTFLIVPQLAKLNNRVPLPMVKNQNLAVHNYLTVFLNRHYVKKSIKQELIEISTQFSAKHPGLQLIYLDANFPFINGFPLLPHLSHNDGRKVDLSFQYTKDQTATNKKPSRSGYGYFEHAKTKEINQNQYCRSKGNWQYDYPRYLSFGQRDDLVFDQKRTKDLLQIILQQKNIQKIFIEPHLKKRMGLTHSKIRYQGCHSVRHDDHIHIQFQ